MATVTNKQTLHFHSLMSIWSTFFPFPSSKASILDLIRFRSFSCSSFVKEQKNVLYNTEDLFVLLLSSFDFTCPFCSVFSPFHSFCTYSSSLEGYILICCHMFSYSGAHCREPALQPTGLEMLSVDTGSAGKLSLVHILGWAAQFHHKMFEVRSSASQIQTSIPLEKPDSSSFQYFQGGEKTFRLVKQFYHQKNVILLIKLFHRKRNTQKNG